MRLTHLVVSTVTIVQEKRGHKEAERSYEMKNGPPKAQDSCETWRVKEKRTSGDITDLPNEGECSEIGGTEIQL